MFHLITRHDERLVKEKGKGGDSNRIKGVKKELELGPAGKNEGQEPGTNGSIFNTNHFSRGRKGKVSGGNARGG